MEYQQLLHFYRTYRERLQIQGKIIGKQFKGVCYLFNSGFCLGPLWREVSNQ